MIYLAILKKIAGFVIENWRVFLFFGLIGCIWLQTHRIHNRDGKIVSLIDEKEQIEARAQRAEAVLVEVKAQGERQAAALVSATAQAQSAALAARKAATAVLSAPVPHDCQGAMDWQAAALKANAEAWTNAHE